MATVFPFKAEYAKSGRAACKLCKNPIPKGDLRLAVMVQSRFHDGRDANWFHSDCFFSKQRPKSVGDIEYFESLRYDDQTKIKSKIDGADAGASSSSGKRKGAAPPGFVAADFSVGYAKTGRSSCVACEEFISKDEVRISKKDYTSETALAFHGGNGMDRWYHVPCFVKVREELEYFVAANKKNLPGLKDLQKEDQTMLQKKLPAITATKRKLEENGGSNGAGPSKKTKTESKSQKGDSHEEKIRRQNEELYKNRDQAEQLKKPELHQILTTNKQDIPHTPMNQLDLVADIMTFGAMKRCTDCKKGQFLYKSGVGYECRGYISEFTKCSFVPDGDVERVKFKVPEDLKEYPIFADRTFKIQKRIMPKHAAPVAAVAATASSSGSQDKGPKLNSKPLSGFKFITYGVSEKEDKKLEELIKKYGGKVTSKMSATVAVAITSKAGFKSSSGTEKAKKYEVPVVSSDFVTNIKEVNYKLAEEISKCLLSDWVKDIRVRLKTLNEEFEKSKDEREGKQLASMKLKMKDGAVVDPQSEMDDGPYHVYKEGKLVYNFVLNRTSVEDGKNSFYKMQIIESDGHPKSYFVFRSYGRIGTDNGGHQTNEQPSIEDAIDLFCTKFYEMTGNRWGSKFVRKPGKYISLDIDYGQKPTEQKAMIPSSETSRLPLPVQALITLIFDVGIMKQTLLEFEIDMDKMPLGKISRKQVLEAYSILTDSLNLREKESDERKYNRLIFDITNRFYTLIPHNFGTQAPPLLNSEEVLKAKIDMLDNLMEIEIAFELMAQGDDGAPPSIDSHYKKLNAEIDLVEAHSEEFKIIEKYLENTHAPTHTNYNLEIEQVFKVVRSGENQRYEPFKDLHNRRLLWHGSRVSNFVGIISQGLRIAPPEAPVTGYMFGKGIYFADMVSKSANYCNASRDNTTGLLMLCEVALGDMHELKQAKETLSKAPKDRHSVKGLGETEPDPSETYTFPDGVMVPYGKPCKSKVKNTALLYNEYIVYDIAQVNIKYLLKVNFNYGKRGRR